MKCKHVNVIWNKNSFNKNCNILVSELSSFCKVSNDYESKHTNHVSANYVFSAFFQDIHSDGGASRKKNFGFCTVKEIVILELVEEVMKVLQNNELIHIVNVAGAQQVHILQLFSYRKIPNCYNFPVSKFSVKRQFLQIF